MKHTRQSSDIHSLCTIYSIKARSWNIRRRKTKTNINQQKHFPTAYKALFSRTRACFFFLSFLATIAKRKISLLGKIKRFTKLMKSTRTDGMHRMYALKHYNKDEILIEPKWQQRKMGYELGDRRRQRRLNMMLVT